MNNVFVDFGKTVGKMKPMHAVNNGPVHKISEDQRISNLEDYKLLKIPYARNHDAASYDLYGGEHTVDVNAIFPDFSKDAYDPASYDFACTDEYIRVTELAGTKTFYRLGSKIEHEIKKYNTLPPKDFHKWAVICEHIIRHYNEGWANGFFYNLVYWEIWNEPDLDKDDATNKRTWGGTKKQFFEFYNVAAAHLKKEFPNLKIGGPALACDEQWAADFLDQLEFAPDFFSWHIYANEPYKVVEMAKRMRKLLDDRGFTKTESILNEWNYIRGWAGQDFIHSMRSINSIKGAAYTCAVMAEGQNAPVDMLMYYDTRPSQYNGLWSFYTGERLKGYYAFLAFSTIYQLGEQLSTEVLGDHVYACAARNEKEAAVVITAFNEDDAAEDVELSLKVLGMQNCKQISCYVLDENSDFECQTDVDINGTIHMKRNSILMLRYEGLN